MSCSPTNIETPIVFHVVKPQGTEIQIARLSTIYQNPYRFSCPGVSTAWILKWFAVPEILKPLSFLVFGSHKVLEFKLPYCPTNVRTPIVSRINGISIALQSKQSTPSQWD